MVLNLSVQEHQERVLARIEARIGQKVTWDDLITGDIEDLGGAETIQDLTEAGLL